MKVCLIRLSAIGDVVHALAVVRRLQAVCRSVEITWIVGALEHKLVAGTEGVEFIVFDKAEGLDAYRKLRRTLAGRRFDALLHMQVSLRANVASALVRADRRIGYDAERSKELHGLFVGERIAARGEQHVQDAILSFLEPLGFEPGTPQWNVPLTDADWAFADEHIANDRKTLCISPASSHRKRNWSPAGYAEIADAARERYGMQIILTGGPSDYERRLCSDIRASMKTDALDLSGKDTLKKLAALTGSCDLVLAPDTGPMHIANAMGTDVLGLHAASNPRRSGPYNSLHWCVDRYPEAARRFLDKDVGQLRWGRKIEFSGVMDLINVTDVSEKLEQWHRESDRADVSDAEPILRSAQL